MMKGLYINPSRFSDHRLCLSLGRDPLRAIEFIADLSLYQSIFSTIPPDISATFSAAPSPIETSLAAASILHTLLRPTYSPLLPAVHRTLLSLVNTDSACRARLYLATALTPYRNITYIDKKKKFHLATDFIIREALKLGTQNHYLDGIPSLFAAAQLLKSPISFDGNGQQRSERVTIGRYFEYLRCIV
jgi:tRNA nucleotidyltransferase (CCA-adding enzyme)